MAGKVVKGIIVEIGGDTTQLGKALKAADEESNKLGRELQQINKMLKFDEHNPQLLAQKQKVLTDVIGETEKKLDALREAERQVQAQFERGETSEEQVRALQREIIRTESQLDSYRHAMGAAESETDEFGDETDEARRALDNVQVETEQTDNALDGLKSAAEKAGEGFTVMKGVIADLIADGLQQLVEYLKEAAKYALNTGMDFEAGMSQVQAVSGASADEMERLTDKAKEMGAKTKFSATESAEAFNYMAMAGWKTEDMLGGIEGIMSLAAASGADLATTSDIVTDALTAMGYSASDSGRLADVMAAAAANANTNVEMMGYSFKYAAPLAGALGYSMEDMAVALGLMANAGIKSETAGTSLRSVFSRLSTDTDGCRSALEEYGFEIMNADGSMKPLHETMQILREAFSGLSESEKIAAAESIAGKNAMSGLLAIVSASDEDFNNLTTAINGSEGAAEEMAATMQDNLAGDVEKLGGAFDTLALSIFENFNGALRTGVQAITGFLEGTSSLSQMFDGIKTAFSQFTAAFQGYLPKLQEMGAQLLQYIGQGIVSNTPKLLTVGLNIVTSLIQGLASQAPRILQAGVQLIGGLVQSIGSALPNVLQAGAQLLTALGQGIAQETPKLLSYALDLVESLADALIEQGPALIDSGISLLRDLVKGISDSLPELISRVPLIISKFCSVMRENGPKIVRGGMDIIMDIIAGILKAIPELVRNIPKIFQAIWDCWTAIDFAEMGKALLDGLWDGIKRGSGALWKKISGWLDGLWGDIKGFFGVHSPSTQMAWIGKMLDEGLALGVTKNAKAPIKAMRALTDEVLGEANGNLDGLAVERSLQVSATSAAASTQAGFGDKLDAILTAIEKGSTILLDGKLLVGGTANRMDSTLGQRRALVARGAV